ncbi:MAG: alpha-ketoacid dehydrogenase subunit beta [Planctomycetota bacterium]
MRELKYTQAMSEAIREEQERDETVFQIGEDIGPVRKRDQLWEQFVANRIWQTPISESGFVGLAAGAAMTGLRPIAVVMYCDFVGVCMDPIVNQAAKVYLMSGGAIKVPMVIRTPAGAGTREGGHHSGSLESWFVHSPGLKVVMPSDPYDAKGLMKSAIRDDGPVVYIQHRILHRLSTQQCPEGEWLVPIGEAAVKREGTDITVIGVSIGVMKALQAAEKLDGKISVEVVDPRSLVPLDMKTILASIKKTGHLLVVHDAPRRGGVGAEIVRRVVEEGFDLLKKPPKVLGGLNTPMPYSAPLEDACLPQPKDIVKAVREMVR